MAAPVATESREAARRSRSKSRSRGTSLGGGKVQKGHRCHGMTDKKRSSKDGKSRRGRSKPREKPRIEYDSPFDAKGRCHYHKNVQLASKKMTGGWKVLMVACPKCMEDKCDDDHDDDKSVKSTRSTRSVRSTSSGGAGGDSQGQFDKNGCCVLHPHIQVAKKPLFGNGWKVVRSCPSCVSGVTVDLDDDAISVTSQKSARSTSSRRSKSKSRGVSGKSTTSGRYGEMPFDGDGYCCRHPSVQIAQKKMMGGFKILKECPDCAQEDTEGKKGSRRSRSRSKSRSRRSSSRRRTTESSGDNQSVASSKKKKRIRVKNLKTDDGNGRVGRYTGYVNDDHVPNGEGVIVYDDETEWAGEWAEGTQRNGKMRKSKQ